MTDAKTNIWNAAERELLNKILDQLIPASKDGNIPAAGSLGVVDFIGGKASEDQSVQELICHGLSVARTMMKENDKSYGSLGSDQRRAFVRQLEETEPEFFNRLLRVTYMGYYSRPDIRELFGLSAEPTQPSGYAVPSESPEEIAALVAPVKSRGRCYRVVEPKNGAIS